MPARHLLPLAALVLFGTLAAGCSSPTASFNYAQLKDRCLTQFQLEPGDVIRVSVWNEPNHSREQVLVRPDGKISLPLLGDIEAAGRSIPELTQIVQDLLKRAITSPRVDINLVTARSYQVYIMGEVRRTGPVTSASPLNVLKALARAGGLSPYARTNRIFIIWKSPRGERRIPINYNELMEGERIEQNIMLCPGDVLVVP